jgi:hypothetical protein
VSTGPESPAGEGVPQVMDAQIREAAAEDRDIPGLTGTKSGGKATPAVRTK